MVKGTRGGAVTGDWPMIFTKSEIRELQSRYKLGRCELERQIKSRGLVKDNGRWVFVDIWLAQVAA